jgi:hypothetical protein
MLRTMTIGISMMIIPLLACQRPQDQTALPRENRITAFSIDFNWGNGGVNGFAPPGMYTQASAAEHLRWYRGLGVNTIQTFCVSCCGYAWFRSDVAPVQPGMKGDFLKEVTEMGHKERMRVLGYFCVGANTYWGETHPDLSYGAPSAIHIPLTLRYIDYLCAEIEDVLEKTAIDGFMLDWFFSPPAEGRVKWLECEKEMYAQLFGRTFPGAEKISEKEELDFKRKAVGRCWKRVRAAAKGVKPDCILWLSCYDLNHPQMEGQEMYGEVDWIMNESPDKGKLGALKKRIGDHTRVIQCLVGWGPQHSAEKILSDGDFADAGLYGFAWPDSVTTVPPTVEAAGNNERLVGNARNIEAFREFLKRKGGI